MSDSSSDDAASKEPLSFLRLQALLSSSDYPPIVHAYTQAKAAQPMMNHEAVVTLLSDLSVELSLDLAPAGDLFTNPRLDEHSDDYIDPENVTLEQFCGRLRRYCEMHGGQEEASHRPKKQRKEAKEEKPASAEKSHRSSKSSRSRKSRSQDERAFAISPPPAVEVMSGPMGKLMARMSVRRPQLESALSTQDPSVLTKAVVDECGFKPSEDQFQQLTLNLVEAFPLAASEDVPEHQFQDLQGVVWKWAEALQVPMEDVEIEDPLTKKLKESIADFESMKEAKLAAGEDVSMLENVLKTLKQQLGKIARDTVGMSKQRKQQIFMEKCTKTMREVFRFYSNQLRLLGKTPSFDVIQRNSMTWNVSKFVCFCRDFELLLDKPKPKKVSAKSLELATVKSIFVKNSVLQKEMEESQFQLALDMAAHLYYDQEYDALNGTTVSMKPTEEKREMLYRFLQFDLGNECLKRAKGFGMPFSSKTDNRVPENDLMKNYKYRPYRHQRATVEEWRQQKAAQQSVNHRPQAKEATPPKRAPADAIVSYSTQAPQPETYVAQKHATKARNPYTWKTLGELNPEEVMGKEEDFDLNNLIADDSSDEDEILKKQYPLAASQPVLQPDPVKADPVKGSKYSTPLLGGIKPNALIKNESRPNLEQMTKQMMQKTKDMSASETRKEKAQLDKVMKVTEVQRERGNKVLGRLRQSSQFA